MKKIQIFNGGVAIIDSESSNKIQINGAPIKEVEATEKNIEKYFKDVQIPDEKTKVESKAVV